MRLRKYVEFLSTQLVFDDVVGLIGEDGFEKLSKHMGEKPAVFCAEKDVNEEAWSMMMGSKVVCENGRGYDVVVYTCDGTNPYRKGVTFEVGGKSYLAYCGDPGISHEEFDKMRSFVDMKEVREDA